MTSIAGVDLGLTGSTPGCACCTTPTLQVGGSASTSPSSTTVLVAGMSCAHCVAAVTEQVSGVDGVTSVAVELDASGVSTVTVHSARPIDPAAVRTAVEIAGYTVTAPATS